MKRYRCQGAITVFLSLISVLFLSLICTLAESARVQGARAQAAAITDMGLFSVFGEYEKDILKDFDVLVLDGAYQTGDFNEERMALHLKEYMAYNINPEKGLFSIGSFKIFPMELSDLTEVKYALATDDNGQAFYQQAVRNLIDNLGSEVLGRYLEENQKAKEQEEAGKDYENSDKEIETKMEELEEERKKQKEENANDTEAEGETSEGESEALVETETAPDPVSNPLDTIKTIKQQGILGLVVKDPSGLSTKEINQASYPSGRERNEGTLPVKKEETGIVADGIFQEYLFMHFSDMTNQKSTGALDYQLEYILNGKSSDTENLKSVVHKLLLIREGTNFLYIMSNSEMRQQADALALAITSGFGLPAFATALSTALILAWAYGESLLDVRTLLVGGKIPLVKNESTWKLTLENLGRLTEILEECDHGGDEGQSYSEYLRVLFLISKKDSYPLRALDMIEGIKKAAGEELCLADHWIVQTEVTVSWNLQPIFLRVPAAFLGTGISGSTYEVKGSFEY